MTDSAVRFRTVAFDDPMWLDLQARFPPTLFQGHRWGRCVLNEYGFSGGAFLAFRGEEPVGGLPFAEIDDFRGLRRQTFPFSDMCEPLGKAWPELERAVLDSGMPWQIRARIDGRLAHESSIAARHHEIVLGTLDETRRRFHHKQRANARYAQNAGVTVRRLHSQDCLDIFFPMFARQRKEKFRLLPQARSFFERVVSAFFPDRGCLFVAYTDAAPIAAIMVLAEGNMLYYKWGSSYPEGLKFKPNNLLFDHAAAYACDQGFRALDLGISVDEGLIRFKDHLGGVQSEVRTLRYNAAPKSGAVLAMEQTLGALTAALIQPDVPLQTAEQAGVLLYRFFA